MPLSCASEGCDQVINKTDKWARIKAHDAGWYFQRDGKVWCPAHRPEYARKLPNVPERVETPDYEHLIPNEELL